MLTEDDPIGALRHLHGRMVARRPVIDRAVRYYDGAHNLAFASEKFLEAFGGLFGAFADNWCGVVTGAVEERLGIQGFRVGDDVKTDDDAKRFWEINELDLQAGMGHVDALNTGAAYVTVWRGEDDNVPEITVDPAHSTIVAAHPKMRRRRQAALRTWCDDDGYEHAELFFPTRVFMFRSKTKRTSGGIVNASRVQWVGEDMVDGKDDLDASFSMENPLGVVPVVELHNKPRLTVSRQAGWAAHSELTPVIPLQDAVNKIIADMLVASEFAAFPQRWLTGYEPAIDPTTKAEIPPNYKPGAGGLWWTADPETKFGQFSAADLSGYVTVVAMLVQHIASITATPPHYLSASADRLSGESIRAAETGLVAKVRGKQRSFGATWEEVMRLAGKVADNTTLAAADQMETVWRDPETRTEAEHVDALLKKKELEIPHMQIWEEAGYTPEQIARFPAMRAQTDLEGMAAAATAGIDLARTITPPAPATPPPPAPALEDV